MAEGWQVLCFEAPDRFYTKANAFLEVKSPPEGCYVLSGLSKEIWNKFESNKQTRSEYVNKMFLWRQLSRCIRTEFPDKSLLVAGSTINGFGLKSSDIDFSFISKPMNTDKQICLNTLTKLLKTLEKEYEQLSSAKIVPATVPVLKFKDTQFDLNVDINCSNVANIRNTYLLHCYAQVDWRVKPLAVVIKLWAKHHKITDSHYRSFSSYLLMLMFINFLQGVQPPVLPCLQDLLKDKFKHDIDAEKLDFFEKLDIPFDSKNRQTLDELLLQFFSYYSNFNYQKNVISVRKGLSIPMLQYKWDSTHDTISYSKGYIFIEEPFHLGNIGTTVRKLSDFERIKSIFLSSYLKLLAHDTLKSIFDSSFS